jgi:hypothetical protein
MQRIKFIVFSLLTFTSLPVFACSGGGGGPYYAIGASTLPDLVRGDIGSYVRSQYGGHYPVGASYYVTIDTPIRPENQHVVPVTIRLDTMAPYQNSFLFC